MTKESTISGADLDRGIEERELAGEDVGATTQAQAPARDREVIQFLAGAPELLDRYRNAPPAARALIHAAMDARRLGTGIGLPQAFLEASAPGYLTDAEWDGLREDWLEKALAYTADPCKGAHGPLTRIRPRPARNAACNRRDRLPGIEDNRDPAALLCSLPANFRRFWAECRTKAPALAVDMSSSHRSHSPENPTSTPQTRLSAPERVPGGRPLRPGRIAVGVSRNDQKDLLRVALGDAGLGAVPVSTANKLQGLEFNVVICWHPLAGLPDTDAFHLEPGRLFVLLTRHRHACIVVGRAGDRELLAGIPPTTPAYLGADDDPVLDGWGTHQAVFAGLELYRIALDPRAGRLV